MGLAPSTRRNSRAGAHIRPLVGRTSRLEVSPTARTIGLNVLKKTRDTAPCRRKPTNRGAPYMFARDRQHHGSSGLAWTHRSASTDEVVPDASIRGDGRGGPPSFAVHCRLDVEAPIQTLARSRAVGRSRRRPKRHPMLCRRT